MTYFELYQAFLKHYNFKDDLNKNNDFYNLLYHYSKYVKNVADFFMYKNKEVDFAEDLEKFKSDLYLLGRYHFPVSYLTKKHYFYGRKFYIHKGALIPRSETEILVDKITLENYEPHLKILDLCSGIGVIGLSLSSNLNAKATLVEKSAIPYYLSLRNRRLLNLQNKVTIQHNSVERFLKMTNKKFDIIVMNPPYISKKRIPEKNVVKYEPKMALFAKQDGLYFYELLFQYLPKLIKNSVKVYLEIDDNQQEPLTDILNNVWWKKYFNIDYEFSKDYHNLTRYLKVEVNRK